MSDPIIAVERLGKCYRIRHQQARQPYVALVGLREDIGLQARVFPQDITLWNALG